MKKLILTLAIVAAITVQKGDEKWQIASDAATTGKAKVGDKVTIQYQMVAKSVEIKSAKK